MQLSARILAKAAACIFKGASSEGLNHIRVVVIDDTWVRATNGRIAFRGKHDLVRFEGWLTLSPKRKLIQKASYVDFGDLEITQETLDQAVICDSYGTPFDSFSAYFDVKYCLSRPEFPDVHLLFEKVGKTGRPSVILDFAIMKFLAAHEQASSELRWVFELGESEFDPIKITPDNGDKWSAVLAPVRAGGG